MKVKASDEAKVLKAADLLNDSMTFYKNNFHIVEKQDILAMVAFDAFFLNRNLVIKVNLIH